MAREGFAYKRNAYSALKRFSIFMEQVAGQSTTAPDLSVEKSRTTASVVIKEHCGCEKGHPEIIKTSPIIKTIKKITKNSREKKKTK